MKSLDLEQVKARLPHRPPILLVDSVVDWVANERIVTRRFFAPEDRVFEGHFPGEPILPGVLTVEAMAQSAGLLVNLSRDKKAEETLFLFMQIEQARFKEKVIPEMTLTMEVMQMKERRDIYWFEGIAKIDDRIAAEASFTAKFIEK